MSNHDYMLGDGLSLLQTYMEKKELTPLYKLKLSMFFNNGGLSFHSHERLYTSGANMDGRKRLDD